MSLYICRGFFLDILFWIRPKYMTKIWDNTFSLLIWAKAQRVLLSLGRALMPCLMKLLIIGL